MKTILSFLAAAALATLVVSSASANSAASTNCGPERQTENEFRCPATPTFIGGAGLANDNPGAIDNGVMGYDSRAHEPQVSHFN